MGTIVARIIGGSGIRASTPDFRTLFIASQEQEHFQCSGNLCVAPAKTSSLCVSRHNPRQRSRFFTAGNELLESQQKEGVTF